MLVAAHRVAHVGKLRGELPSSMDVALGLPHTRSTAFDRRRARGVRGFVREITDAWIYRLWLKPLWCVAVGGVITVHQEVGAGLDFAVRACRYVLKEGAGSTSHMRWSVESPR